jgi:hypothetical protein
MLEHANGTKIPSLDSSASDKSLIIYYSPSEAYFREQLQSRAYQEQLIHFCKEYLGSGIRIQIELKDAGESLAAQKGREQKERIQSAREKAQNHPIILEAKSLFGGELGPIEVKELSHADL